MDLAISDARPGCRIILAGRDAVDGEAGSAGFETAGDALPLDEPWIPAEGTSNVPA
jgi:hypothetical protein